MPAPQLSVDDLRTHKDNIDALQRLQEEQNSRIQGLEQILSPLSPSGRITPVPDSGAGGIDAGRECRVRDYAASPDARDQVVLADDPLAVLDQILK